MREFVFGTDNKYDILKNRLNDNMCHAYENCIFPNSFSKRSGRIGFEKERETDLYVLYIDKGLSCSLGQVPELLREWLSLGTLKFIDFNDVKVFLRSLRCLY